MITSSFPNPFQFNNVPYWEKYRLPTGSGIYYVLNLRTKHILYIGKAINIRKRWTVHHRRKDLWLLVEKFGSYQICIAWELRPPQGLEKIEKHRIHAFEPLLNYADAETSSRIIGVELGVAGQYSSPREE